MVTIKQLCEEIELQKIMISKLQNAKTQVADCPICSQPLELRSMRDKDEMIVAGSCVKCRTILGSRAMTKDELSMSKVKLELHLTVKETR